MEIRITHPALRATFPFKESKDIALCLPIRPLRRSCGGRRVSL
nr:MAG TPA: hypothetical protein [Caudoviricetes sp.]